MSIFFQKILTCATKILNPKKMRIILNLICLLTVFSNFAFQKEDPYERKRITDKEYRYEFYITSKKVKPKENLEYFWFKGGLIHNAQSGTAGDLLNGSFVKFYHSNQLAEKGTFKKGLRTKEWKTWYTNGKLSSIQNWSSGIKSGSFTYFDEDGNITETGKYRNGRKTGKWINFIKKDTTMFKRGEVVIPKPKKVKKQKNKKEKQGKEGKVKKEKNKKNNKENNPTQNQTQDTVKKKGFFKRLFSKKSKEKVADGKGA